MLSMQFIRENPDAVHRSLTLRHTDAPVDEALSLDEDRRCLLGEVEKLKADRNKAGKVIGKASDKVERDQLIAAQREAADRIDELDTQLRDVDERLRDALSQIPNLVDDSVPEGEGGETHFLDKLPSDCADGDAPPRVLQSVTPRAGSILLFPHATPHEGTAVGSHRKLLLRGDLY